MRRCLRAACAPILLGLLGAAPTQAAATDLAAHRAHYDLTLQSARGDVTAASGSMSYEVIDACDGWAVRQRLTMVITDREGRDIDMVSDYTTWESKDGLKLRYHMRQTTDQSVTSDIAGNATLQRGASGGQAHYTAPEEANKKLPPGTLLPMAHTAAILKAAESGKKFLSVPLFDGTGASGAQDTSIVISSWSPPHDSKWPALGKLSSGRVRVAFFDRQASAQEPDYEVGMRYWENGIADELSMDFGDFVMNGKLNELTLPKPGC